MPASRTLNSSIRAHAAFLMVAGLLSLQGCGGPVSASPAAMSAPSAKPTQHVIAASKIEAGRYLVKIGGCNDCHTPGYVEQLMMTGKEMPEADWLMGADVGFAGAWGVSYPANLRLSVQTMTEDEFVAMGRAGQGRPPMPWPSLMAMSESDLKAVYAYIRSLGPRGAPAPAALSPGVAPDRPYMLFEPVAPKIPAKN
jgi:mono/diheme cytochrome c family protein